MPVSLPTAAPLGVELPRLANSIGVVSTSTATASHSTRARYEQGCRCPACRQANRVYQRGYRLRYRGDTLSSYVQRALARGE